MLLRGIILSTFFLKFKHSKIQNIKYKKQQITTTLVRSWWNISNKHPFMNITVIMDSQHLWMHTWSKNNEKLSKCTWKYSSWILFLSYQNAIFQFLINQQSNTITITLLKIWSFLLRISWVNATKSTWKTSFYVQC